LSPTHRYRRAAPLLLVLGALSLGACRRDEGPQRLARAERLYVDLVERGVPPGHPAYEDVIAQLEAVPRDSTAWPEAGRRLETLRALRTPLPPRPLGRPGEDGGFREEPPLRGPGHSHGDEEGT
jgi:hypothetical protein